MDRVLSLDISTKTGWALMLSGDKDFTLETYGHIEKSSEPAGKYPGNYIDWAYQCFGEIVKLIDEHQPTVLVIEETASGSQSIYSQKILEYIHFLVAKLIRDTGIQAHYYMTEEWRRIAGCKMTKEESKHNKKVKKSKETTGKRIAYDENGKRIGKLTRKHINVRRANELFGQFLAKPLIQKDEDTADALLLAYTFHAKKAPAENSIEALVRS